MLEEKRGGGTTEGSQLLMWPIYKMQARTHACIKVLGRVRLVFLVPHLTSPWLLLPLTSSFSV